MHVDEELQPLSPQRKLLSSSNFGMSSAFNQFLTSSYAMDARNSDDELDAYRDDSEAVTFRRMSPHEMKVFEDDRAKKSPLLLLKPQVVLLCFVAIFQSFCQVSVQSILFLQFNGYFGISEANASTVVAIYIIICNLLGPIGGMLSDWILGNYMTQLLSCILWTAGAMVMLAGASFQEHQLSHTALITLSLGGMTMSAAGYAMINPIQPVFVRNQLGPVLTPSLESKLFSLYYLCCNIGNTLGEFGSPYLKKVAKPFDFRYSITYAVIAGASIVSSFLFILGTCVYHHQTPPLLRKLLNRLSSCCCGFRLISSSPIVQDIQEGYDDLESLSSDRTSYVNDSAYSKYQSRWSIIYRSLLDLMYVLRIFIPLPIFWALYFNQNSTWVEQAKLLDRDIHLFSWNFTIAPDMVPGVNDVLVVLFIPLFSYIIDPLIELIGFKLRPLRKLVIGMFCILLAYIAAAILWVMIEKTQYKSSQSYSIFFQLPQYLLITVAEIYTSIPGLEFAYTQSPKHLRGVVTACWFVSAALGNVIVIGFEQIHFSLSSIKFFVYAGVMLVFTILFSFITCCYTYRRYRE